MDLWCQRPMVPGEIFFAAVVYIPEGGTSFPNLFPGKSGKNWIPVLLLDSKNFFLYNIVMEEKYDELVDKK